jgi:hypothetical protein
LKTLKTKTEQEKEKNEKKIGRLVEEIFLLKKAKRDESGMAYLLILILLFYSNMSL